MIGGALSCGLTHTAVVPLDLVKCRMQVDAAKYPSLGKGLKVRIRKYIPFSVVKGSKGCRSLDENLEHHRLKNTCVEFLVKIDVKSV